MEQINNQELESLAEAMGARLQAEMRKAMAQGEMEFKDMAERLAHDMAKLVLKQILAGFTSHIPNQRGDGNSVSAGQFSQLLTQMVQQGSRYL